MILKFDDRRNICTACGTAFEPHKGHVCASVVQDAPAATQEAKTAKVKRTRKRRRKVKRSRKTLP